MEIKELKCNGCKESLPLTKFSKCHSTTRGYQYKCSGCMGVLNHTEEVMAKKREDIKGWRNKNPEKVLAQKKRHYEKNKEVCKQRAREWYHSNKDRSKDNAMLRKYGITLKQCESLKEKQEYCCALCGEHESANKQGLVVDHCHVSGNVRKLLCPPCNVGLGMFKDNPELLIKAADYIKEHNG
jgi:hypothetical protein